MTAHDISLADAMIQRRSVRGFTDKPVPQEVLDAVFSLAQRSPSNCNIQPWKVWVASGAVRDALRDAMAEEMRRDDTVFIMGEEVAEYQGAYKVTRELLQEFGDKRVVDTPITEHGFAGLGVGAPLGLAGVQSLGGHHIQGGVHAGNLHRTLEGRQRR